MSQRKHFHTFDALRFFAFFLVFLSHIPLVNTFFNTVGKSGGIGVNFFFVLSGFLISYIILFEKSKQGNFNLRKFFARRILRIWPLFFAMILFAFLTPYILDIVGLSYSNEGYAPNWLMSCLFLENYQMMWNGQLPNVSPLPVMGTLCIEEHFYIIWALLFYFTPIKKIPWIIGGSILTATIARIYYAHINIADADVFSNLDYFAFGAIPAFFIIKKEKTFEQLSQLSGRVKYLISGMVILYIFLAPNISFPLQHFINPLIFGSLFMLLIFFTIPSKNRIFISDKNILSKLGIYTYGLYLFHTIVINFLLQIFKLLELDLSNTLFSFVFFILALSLTIGISILSYHLFEYPFLKLKKYFY